MKENLSCILTWWAVSLTSEFGGGLGELFETECGVPSEALAWLLARGLARLVLLTCQGFDSQALA